MSILSVMDQSGHSEHAFDPKDGAATAKMLEIVREHVNEKKFMLAERGPDGQVSKVGVFNPNAIESLLIPQLRGG